jgi:hypothetical protein
LTVPAQREAPEALDLLRLAEDGLDDRFAPRVDCAAIKRIELGSHVAAPDRWRDDPSPRGPCDRRRACQGM